ncbi:hypothetical protein DPF_1467 [Desulfoplanes formicivorans]|uniref:DUF86 domain-containing protein n=2 Tax=Desulfoplanes formicivorans TaxID=1592317 RepID=A0A194AI52_9BACT|nr:hypothetical protein DPF_1467 [Desulfoplanes formicivorans]
MIMRKQLQRFSHEDQVLLSKLTSLKRCVDRIRSKTPATPAELQGDMDLQDIISLNLQRAVQICVDIASHIVADLDVRPPMTMAESFERLRECGILSDHVCTRMKKSVGFRNIAVHDYFSIDWNIVHTVCTNHLDDFSTFAREIMHWMQAGTPDSCE